MSLQYALNTEYTLSKALLWGNFEGHVLAAKESGNWKDRIIHALIATAEFLPGLSQLASVIEMIVIDYFRNHPEFPSENNGSLFSIKGKSTPLEPTSSKRIEVLGHTAIATNLKEKKIKLDVKKQQTLEFERGPTNDAKEITEALQQKQHLLDQRELPLLVNPAIPKKEYPPDHVRAQQWIDSCDGIYKNLAERIIHNIQHITFAQLEENLKKCVSDLNKKFQEKTIKEYAVGIVIGKSQQWVASLAIEHLSILPSSYFNLGYQGTILFDDSYVSKEELKLSETKEKTLVIFDDCSYTGSQLMDNLYKIDKALKPKIKLFSVRKKIFIVIPFLSSKVKEKLKDKKYENFDFEIITSDISLHSMDKIFSLEELQTLEDVNVWTGSVGRDRTLCYTDWRFPDGTSTFRPISWDFHSLSDKGESKYHQKRKELEEKNIDFSSLPKEEKEQIRKNFLFSIIETKEIKRPYRLAKPIETEVEKA